MLTDLGHLRTFVTVAEECHLTRAAERLYISQSAASSHIRALEENLGFNLFSRTNRNLELTRAGELMLMRARVLLGEEAQFASFACELRGKMEGTLSVSASSESGTRVGEVVTALREAHPLVTIDLCTRPSNGARQALKSGELDVSIFLGRAGDPLFTIHEIEDVEFCIAAPAAWHDEVKDAGWEELSRMPWITPNASSARAGMLSELFSQRGIELNSVVRFTNGALGRTVLEAGGGLMMLRKDIAHRGRDAGTLCICPLATTRFPVSIVHLTSRARDPLINAFLDASTVVWPHFKRVPAEASMPLKS